MKAGIRQPHPATHETLGNKRLSSRVIVAAVGLVGTLGFTFPAAASAGENDPIPTIMVQVYNYSQASLAILAGAEREAGRILGEAGLRAVWLGCPVGPSTASLQGPCQKAPEATDVRLRVLAAPIQNKFQNTVFGFTVHPALASVYYEFALRRAKSDDAEFETPIILGCVIAHEIGHLLLGPNSHSSTGIMQLQWDHEQVRQIMMGTLLFTPGQSKFMREVARTRMGLQTGILREQRLTTVDQRAEPRVIPQRD